MKKIILFISLAINLLLVKPCFAARGDAGNVQIADGDYLATAQVNISTIAANGATLIIPASVKNLSIDIQNLSPLYRVALGSSTSVNMSNGWILSVSTNSLAAYTLGALSGPIYGFGEGSGTVVPSVSYAVGTNQ